MANSNEHNKFIPTTQQKNTIDGFQTKYKREYAERVYGLALLGSTKQQVAELLGIHTTTLYAWFKKHKALRTAWEEGTEIATTKVAKSLLKRAQGYESVETKVNVVDGVIIKTEILKHIPADIKAIQYWLNNRTDQWNNSPEIQVNTQVNVYKPHIKRFDGTMDEDDEE